jgi:hypothetical protein
MIGCAAVIGTLADVTPRNLSSKAPQARVDLRLARRLDRVARWLLLRLHACVAKRSP